jgi:pyridoxine 5-phosphate synthase
MTRLSVNLNKVALLRNQRALDIPSVTRMARIAIAAGAHGITVHPRPDERHIRAADVRDLSRLVAEHPHVEFNIEGNPFEEVLGLVLEVRPHQFTLVPDAPGAVTSDHGWNLAADGARLGPIVERVKRAGVRVSLFMDAEPVAMKRAADLGAQRVELYTEPYAASFGTPSQDATLRRYVRAGEAATSAGLGLNAGHDLSRANLPAFVAAIPNLLEVSIGHALIADALELGMAATVRAYLDALSTQPMTGIAS